MIACGKVYVFYVADTQIEGWVGGSACIFFLRKWKKPYDLMDDPLPKIFYLWVEIQL